MTNEQIEKLAQDCFIYGEKEFTGKVVGFNYNKFAELIVRECAKIVSNKATLETNEDYREGFHRAKQFIWQDINKHFGVEE